MDPSPSIGIRFTDSTTSPGRSPAAAAGEPGMGEMTVIACERRSTSSRKTSVRPRLDVPSLPRSARSSSTCSGVSSRVVGSFKKLNKPRIVSYATALFLYSLAGTLGKGVVQSAPSSPCE